MKKKFQQSRGEALPSPPLPYPRGEVKSLVFSILDIFLLFSLNCNFIVYESPIQFYKNLKIYKTGH
jgi:hypothetical protein